MKIWIKNPLAILAENAGGGIVIDGCQIAQCVASGAKPKLACDEVFDASEHVVLPGLINVHHHFYQTLTRAFAPALNKELFQWLKALYPVWANLTPEDVYLSTRLALAELLLSGCTTASDHHYIFPDAIEDAIDIQVDAVRDFRMRVTLTRGSMNLSVDDGGLPPRHTVQDADVILSDCERVIDRYHCSDEGSFIQIALAPCSPFSVTQDIMKSSADLAQSADVALHTHLGETEDENNFCMRQFGCRPLEYLQRCGWMSARTWLAHGIHFNDDEIAELGRAGVGISHCPGSNMLLASGICRGIELEQAGSPVGIGVDGSASQDASNMIQEVRYAFQIQRLRYGSRKMSHLDALRWATEGSAKCLNRNDIGVLQEGKQADLALFKLDELRFSGSGDPLAALVLCGAHRADRVMIGGSWRVRDGEIADVDVHKLMADHCQAAKRLQAGCQSAGL